MTATNALVRRGAVGENNDYTLHQSSPCCHWRSLWPLDLFMSPSPGNMTSPTKTGSAQTYRKKILTLRKQKSTQHGIRSVQIHVMCSSPFVRPSACTWMNASLSYMWRMASATYGYLLRCRTSLLCNWYQFVLFGAGRGTLHACGQAS